MPTLFESIQPTLGVFEGSDHEIAHSQEFCKFIAAHATSESDFPAECKKYKDAVALLKRHNSNNPYAGMSPGDAVDAMRAKSEGRMNSAQIKRRMTTRKNGRTY
ncbi:hypothetical protein ACHAWU_006454 [Discostella pseudostelligera]|uniref:Uncharacterized protein n=1 Tax=Discostella pseudostelligera TaxID=259834 RepID=A0ABD3N5G7_9STRA